MQATPKQTYLTEIPAKKDSVSSESAKKMAAPSDYPPRVSSEPREDCRDYLRTGRCKYGASCKYNHPPNVQSGGGIKGPIDPSEPLFPLRPNEPPCQYYMKHGSCKFGQACKFHHPPQAAVRAALVGGGPVVMSGGAGRTSEPPVAQHIVLKTLGSEHSASSSGMTVQFLPQRPDEADCIYFLRNGRCKYGATCRYHHPISVQHRKQVDISRSMGRQPQHPTSLAPIDGRDRSASMPEAISQPMHFVSQQPSSSSYGQRGQPRNVPSSVGGPTHILVADGSVSFVTMSSAIGGSSMEASYQHLASSPSAGIRQGYSSDPSSPLITGSSVASSYETAISEVLPTTLGEASSISWNRPTRTSSGGSLNALPGAESPSQVHPQYRRSGSRVSLSTSASDTNIAGRYYPGGQYMESSQSYSATSNAWSTAPPATQVAKGENPRGQHEGNAIPFEQRYQTNGNRYRNVMSTQARFAEGDVEFYVDSRTHNASRLPSRHSSQSGDGRQNQPRSRLSEFDDDGMSKMTSALLTMLDTPEEAGGDRYAHNSTPSENLPVTFRSNGSTVAPNPFSGSRAQERGMSLSNSQDITGRGMLSSSLAPHGEESSRQGFHVANPRHQNGTGGDVGTPANWSPTLNGATSIGRPLEQNVQSMTALQPRPSAPNSPYGGLFLS